MTVEDTIRSQQDGANNQTKENTPPKKESYKQPKQLKITPLRDKDEFHPGGFIFKVIDNDGVTVLKEYWDYNKGLGIQFCRNWLKVQAGEELEFYKPEPTPKVEVESKENNAEPKQVG